MILVMILLHNTSNYISCIIINMKSYRYVHFGPALHVGVDFVMNNVVMIIIKMTTMKTVIQMTPNILFIISSVSSHPETFINPI